MSGKDIVKRGYPPLQAGLVASLLLIFAGFAAALGVAVISGGRLGYLSPFFEYWPLLACFGGGLVAGVLGGAGVWPRAGGIGPAVGFPALLLWGISPGNPSLPEIAACLLVPAVISSLGALAGANLRVRRGSAGARYRQCPRK